MTQGEPVIGVVIYIIRYGIGQAQSVPSEKEVIEQDGPSSSHHMSKLTRDTGELHERTSHAGDAKLLVIQNGPVFPFLSENGAGGCEKYSEKETCFHPIHDVLIGFILKTTS
jgi:hypothetical protein